MGIKIKREPFLKSEKIYRIFTALTFYITFGAIISAVIVVPVFASSEAYWVMVVYSGFYYLYCAFLAGCAISAAIACFKTKNEVLGVQSGLHIICLILSVLNCKLFTALFLYGIKKDGLAEKLIGSDTDAFVTEATSQWIYLILAVMISCILAVMSTVKLAKERKSR